MADPNTIQATADMIECSFNAAEVLGIKEMEDFAYGITTGVKMATRYRGSSLTASEIYSDPNFELGWSDRLDFVLGALTGVLSTTSEFDHLDNKLQGSHDE